MSKKPSTTSAMLYLHRKAKEAPKSDLRAQQRKLFRKPLVPSKAPKKTKDHDLDRRLDVSTGSRIDGGVAKEPKGFNERAVSFLDLPGEIRNQIYEYALVRDVVFIVSAPCEPPQMVGKIMNIPMYFRTKFSNLPLLERPVRQRSCWKSDPTLAMRHRENALTDDIPFRNKASLKPYLASYELGEGQNLSLNLLLANKQLNHEAGGLFFGKNKFVFQSRWDEACSAPLNFLYDQTKAWSLLRSLHLSTEFPPPYSCCERYRGPTDLTSLATSSSQWKQLVKALQQMSLRHFGLTLCGTLPGGFEEGYYKWERWEPWISAVIKLRRCQFRSVSVEVLSCPHRNHVPPRSGYGHGVWTLADTISNTAAFAERLQDKLVQEKASHYPVKIFRLHHHGAGCLLLVRSVQEGKIPSTWVYNQGLLTDISDWKDRKGEIINPDFWR